MWIRLRRVVALGNKGPAADTDLVADGGEFVEEVADVGDRKPVGQGDGTGGVGQLVNAPGGGGAEDAIGLRGARVEGKRSALERMIIVKPLGGFLALLGKPATLGQEAQVERAKAG